MGRVYNSGPGKSDGHFQKRPGGFLIHNEINEGNEVKG